MIISNPPPPRPFSPLTRFSSWRPWFCRHWLENEHLAGVYILGFFPVSPPPRAMADPSSQEVIYVGMAIENTFSQEWAKFHQSAFEGDSEHFGGLVYTDRAMNPQIGNEKVGYDLLDDLYVATLAVEENLYQEEYIRLIERHILSTQYTIYGDGCLVCNGY